jgi:hypothetical protein
MRARSGRAGYDTPARAARVDIAGKRGISYFSPGNDILSGGSDVGRDLAATAT